MKLLSSFVAVMFVAAEVAAQAASFERAPELPDLTQAVEQLRHGESLPSVSGAALAAPAAKAACPVLSLNGAKLSRAGAFTSDWDVEVGGKKAGKIGFDGDAVVYKDGLGNVAAKSAGSAVTGCDGAAIGSIEIQNGSSSNQITIKDAKGQVAAQTGWIDDVGFAFAGPSGGNVAKIDKDHWYSDTVTLTIAAGTDPRLIALASVLNTAAVYHRAAERRRDRMGDGPHGRGDR